MVQAELAALGDDLSRSGRQLGRALLPLGVALFVCFWAIGLVVFVAVEVVHLWLPLWAAAAVVLAVALLIMIVLAVVGRRRLQLVEDPAVTVKRHWRSHRHWWLEHFPAAGESADRRESQIPAGQPEGLGGQEKTGEPDGRE